MNPTSPDLTCKNYDAKSIVPPPQKSGPMVDAQLLVAAFRQTGRTTHCSEKGVYHVPKTAAPDSKVHFSEKQV